MSEHLTLGAQAEQFACHYLQQHGLKLVEKNYHCRFGEIDLIMKDKNHLVFVEVRFRSSQDFGGALESVTWSKQQKLIRSAQYYLQQKKLSNKILARFDILAIHLNSSQWQPEWIQNAIAE